MQVFFLIFFVYRLIFVPFGLALFLASLSKKKQKK